MSLTIALECFQVSNVVHFFQSGIWEASEVETSRGSIRIQHLTAVSAAAASSRASSASMGSACGGGISGAISSASSGITAGGGGASNNPRFPKLEECAHFHYDCVELPQLKVYMNMKAF